ncbi:hypothetical protein COU15_00420 [Candidatus Kaiserbacteria bacterium CG10_big_fil_rev_8_21_14_0_10_45_20]|uniref:Uncharacterized protein n=1 Tax=Candidatus Kaiserbacteria bacterium CG10_big_fil_rev_8_21_14_0_10_45_20 TaxID=1974607 RepID=A0A2H0UIL8_9BACT|nr:MAG: hypothetical protein COU15_00420 [Candidatus Kaiserbacteria bacterium CG10_big_fil_rev_8_21_14_0_10_45_20]
MKKETFSLMIGIAVPLVFVLIVIISSLLPSLLVKPQHDFVFSVNNDGYYGVCFENEFAIVDGRLSSVPNTVKCRQGATMQANPPLYYYSVEADTVKKISLADVADTAFVAGPSSPDGYTVTFEYGNYSFGIFGGGGGTEGYFIGNQKGKKRLEGISAITRYNSDIQVVGWVQ